MTQATDRNYWISPTALTISLNALDNPNYMQVSLTSGAAILCYMQGIEGIGYDDGHNYRRWLLTADSVAFGTDEKKYVYVRIPRTPASMQNDPLCAGITPIKDQLHAQLCYPSEQIDLYGCTHTHDGYDDDEVTQLGSRAYYYIFLGGIISEVTVPQGAEFGIRYWLQSIATGYLASDEAIANPESEWYVFNAVDDIVTFLKRIRMKAGTFFYNLFAKQITFEREDESGTQGTIDKVASYSKIETPDNKAVVTTAYIHDREPDVEKKYLRKDQNDMTAFCLEMKELKVNEKADIFGNVTIGTPSLPADMQHWGKSEWGTFIKGILTGSGAQIDINGNAELESLIIRRFLEVPELRYNRVSVHSGTEWFTKGSGLIESVEPIDATHGKVKLHLEDGEISTIAEDDYCMGIFHNLNGNAEQTTDDKQGTMEYSGFCTVYFRVQEITETAHNSEFIYELRPVSEGWSHQYHPQPQMAFACYANPNNKDRQSAVLKTTDYTVYIENSTQWTFGPDNYYLIMGQLEGFSVWATNKAGQRYLKHLHGNGTMLGNVYMFGVIDQFDRLADTVEVTASPRINADYSLADGETMTLTAKMLSYDGIKRTGVVYTIKRYSDIPASDTEWNARRGNDIKDGTIDLTTEDTKIGEGVFDPAVQFTIVGTRQLPTDEGGEDYSVERDIVVKNVGGFTLTDDLGYDIFIDPNESKVITFDVDSPRSGTVTQQVTSWRIERDSGDASADLTWNNSVKALTFRNPTLPHRIEIEQSDLSQIRDYTKFLITAYFNDTPIAQTEYTI